MKKMIGVAVLLLSVNAAAQTSSPSAVQFLANELKAGEGITAYNLSGEKIGGAYFPLRALNLPWPNIADVGAGATTPNGTSVNGLISARINIPQIANGILGTKWFTAATSGPALPTLFLGPCIRVESNIRKTGFKNDGFLLLGIPFGSVFAL